MEMKKSHNIPLSLIQTPWERIDIWLLSKAYCVIAYSFCTVIMVICSSLYLILYENANSKFIFVNGISRNKSTNWIYSGIWIKHIRIWIPTVNIAFYLNKNPVLRMFSTTLLNKRNHFGPKSQSIPVGTTWSSKWVSQAWSFHAP